MLNRSLEFIASIYLYGRQFCEKKLPPNTLLAIVCTDNRNILPSHDFNDSQPLRYGWFMVLMRSITPTVKYASLKQTYYILFIYIRYASHDLQAFYFSDCSLKLLRRGRFAEENCLILIRLPVRCKLTKISIVSVQMN